MGKRKRRTDTRKERSGVDIYIHRVHVEQLVGHIDALQKALLTDAVKNIIETWAKNARKHERMGEWIDRIGWERFFDLTGIPFTMQLIDDFTLATETFRSTPTFKW